MHLLRLCRGKPLCATCAALHRFVTLGTVLELNDVRCTAQICYSWDSLGIEGAGVRKYLSLSERGGTTS